MKKVFERRTLPNLSNDLTLVGLRTTFPSDLNRVITASL